MAFSCAQATALCRSLWRNPNPQPAGEAWSAHGESKPATKYLATFQRVERRAQRRADGIVIPPAQAAPLEPAVADVKLRGFQVLRQVFPDVPPTDLICSLAAVQKLPVEQRAAAAARHLLAAALRDEDPTTPSDAPAPAPSGLQRSKTVASVLYPEPRGLGSAPSASASSSSPWVSTQVPILECLPKPPTLLRAVSAPLCYSDAAAMGPYTSAALAPIRLEMQLERPIKQRKPREARQFTANEDPLGSIEDTWEEIGGRLLNMHANHRGLVADSYGYDSRKDTRPARVNPSLLRVPVPSKEVMKAVELAQERAAEEAQAQESSEDECSSEEESDDANPLTSWSALQRFFLQEHGDRIRKELGGVEGKQPPPEEVKLEPVSPICEVQDRFMSTVRQAAVLPIPAFHGTKARNVPSIAQRGLIVPGSQGVTVANGSAHGVGIYAATLGSSWLSKGFCDQDKMFICGVADVPSQPGLADSAPVKWTGKLGRQHRQHRVPASRAPKPAPVNMMGRLPVHKDTGAVRHVGNAMVIFKEAHVAPLFLASGWKSAGCGSAVQPGGLGLWPSQGNPNAKQWKPGVGRGQVLIQGSGEVVWQAPKAVQCDHSLQMKRRFEGKKKDLRRAADVYAKYSAALDD